MADFRMFDFRMSDSRMSDFRMSDFRMADFLYIEDQWGDPAVILQNKGFSQQAK